MGEDAASEKGAQPSAGGGYTLLQRRAAATV